MSALVSFFRRVMGGLHPQCWFTSVVNAFLGERLAQDEVSKVARVNFGSSRAATSPRVLFGYPTRLSSMPFPWPLVVTKSQFRWKNIFLHSTWPEVWTTCLARERRKLPKMIDCNHLQFAVGYNHILSEWINHIVKLLLDGLFRLKMLKYVQWAREFDRTLFTLKLPSCQYGPPNILYCIA